jgi:hypothetical protein
MTTGRMHIVPWEEYHVEKDQSQILIHVAFPSQSFFLVKESELHFMRASFSHTSHP